MRYLLGFAWVDLGLIFMCNFFWNLISWLLILIRVLCKLGLCLWFLLLHCRFNLDMRWCHQCLMFLLLFGALMYFGWLTWLFCFALSSFMRLLLDRDTFYRFNYSYFLLLFGCLFLLYNFIIFLYNLLFMTLLNECCWWLLLLFIFLLFSFNCHNFFPRRVTFPFFLLFHLFRHFPCQNY